jgi:hypothetical protein
MSVGFYRALGGTVPIRSLPNELGAIIYIMFISAVFGLSFNAVDLVFATRRFRDNLFMHTDEGRQGLREEIKRLSNIEARYLAS